MEKREEKRIQTEKQSLPSPDPGVYILLCKLQGGGENIFVVVDILVISLTDIILLILYYYIQLMRDHKLFYGNFLES